MLPFCWCDSSQNKSDILSKHSDNAKVYHIIKDIFDYQVKIVLLNLPYYQAHSIQGLEIDVS